MKLIDKSNYEILEELIVVAENLKEINNSYSIMYPHFLSFFKLKSVLRLEDIVVGISMVYSWMPTVLKSLNLDDSDKLVAILNAVKQGTNIQDDEIDFLKTSFNNSLVGTSKLLHFINPSVYAIWDSRVFRFLHNAEPHQIKFKQSKVYLEYIKLLKELSKEERFNYFYILMKKHFKYDITKFRALELALFSSN